MKKLTCKDLGGACDHVFEAETFQEMAEMSKAHGMEMFQKQDAAHLKAMEEMQALMRSPDAMNKWFAAKQELFNQQPEIKSSRK